MSRYKNSKGNKWSEYSSLSGGIATFRPLKSKPFSLFDKVKDEQLKIILSGSCETLNPN